MTSLAFLLDGRAEYTDLRSPVCIYAPLVVIVASWFLIRWRRSGIALMLATASAFASAYRPYQLYDLLSFYPYIEQGLMIGFAALFPFYCIARYYVIREHKEKEPDRSAAAFASAAPLGLFSRFSEMTQLRRVLFVPASAFIAVGVWWVWERILFVVYVPGLLQAIVSATPTFVGHFLPVALFVSLATRIAPMPGMVTVTLLGLAAGVVTCLLGPSDDTVEYATGVAGAIAGASIGMLIGFMIVRKRAGPNKSPEPTPTTVTPRATEGKSK